MSEIAHCHWAK